MEKLCNNLSEDIKQIKLCGELTDLVPGKKNIYFTHIFLTILHIDLSNFKHVFLSFSKF